MIAKQQYDSAKVNFRKSINASARNNVLIGLSSGYLGLGKVFLATEPSRLCIILYVKGNSIGQILPK